MSFPFRVRWYLLSAEHAALVQVAPTLPGVVQELLQPVTGVAHRMEAFITVPSLDVAQQAVDAFEALVESSEPFSHQWRVSKYAVDSLRHFTAFKAHVFLERRHGPPPLPG